VCLLRRGIKYPRKDYSLNRLFVFTDETKGFPVQKTDGERLVEIVLQAKGIKKAARMGSFFGKTS
jgi:hypothetical protein